MDTPHKGWFYCDGSPKNKQIYSRLFNIIGVTFGDDGDNFKLPDLRSEFIRGYDNRAKGSRDPNRIFGSKQLSSNKIHSHNVEIDKSGLHYHTSNLKNQDGNRGGYHTPVDDGEDPYQTESGGNNYWDGGYAHTTDGSFIEPRGNHNHNIYVNNSGGVAMPKNISLLPCIKY